MMFLKVIFMILFISNSASAKLKIAKIEETFLLSQTMKERFTEVTLKSSEREGDHYYHWSGEDVKMHQQNFTCPWKYVLVYNSNRIPSTILEASCLPEQCSLPEESSDSSTEMNQGTITCQRNAVCSPIHYFRWVQVKDQRRPDGSWNYVKRLLPITVGCTLTLRPVKTLESIENEELKLK